MVSARELVDEYYLFSRKQEEALWAGTHKHVRMCARRLTKLHERIVKNPDALQYLSVLMDDPDPEMKLSAACLLAEAGNELGICYLRSIANKDFRARVKLGLE